MNIFTDGIRSARLIAFAKKKLLALKDLGETTKALLLNGYLIRLFSLDGIEKINITAPPVIVVSHIEFPVASEPGYEYVYYSEPYGSNAGKLGPVGNSSLITYQVYRFALGAAYIAPGAGVIFSSLHDLYSKSEGFFNAQDGYPVETVGFLQTMAADFTARDLSPATEAIGESNTSSSPVGCWMVSVGNAVYASFVDTMGDGSNTFNVFAFAQNGHAAHELFDMDGEAVRAQTGVPAHLRVKCTYVYPSPLAGARMAVYCDAWGGTEPGAEKDLYSGVYFFDLLLNPVDDAHPTVWLSWGYVGRSRTYPLGGSWVYDGPMPWLGGPVVNYYSQLHKSCMYPNDSGGVSSLVFTEVDSTIGEASAIRGEYSFTPGFDAVRNTGPAFPASVIDWQTWPTVFRGQDSHLCVMEKVAEVAGEPTHEVVGLYVGAPSGWTQVAASTMPLLAVRPVLVSSDRLVMLGVVWDDAQGSCCAE
ncbi:MAG: hypothetical protein AB7E55_36035, partial [Pigmentiphaga sp.]